jgi:Ca2+/Na+ antiporter
MREDVAGATFMAMASSSPELFINCVGTFVTEGDIGVGAVVGSAVFNVLAVPACCGLFANMVRSERKNQKLVQSVQEAGISVSNKKFFSWYSGVLILLELSQRVRRSACLVLLIGSYHIEPPTIYSVTVLHYLN